MAYPNQNIMADFVEFTLLGIEGEKITINIDKIQTVAARPGGDGTNILLSIAGSAHPYWLYVTEDYDTVKAEIGAPLRDILD
jgi:hypothetical protein